MKKIIIAFLLVVITVGMFVPTAYAGVLGVLNYSVSSSKVELAANGTGSFSITTPGADKYAAVQYEVQLSNDVSISVSYSDQKIKDPLAPQVDPGLGYTYFSTGMAVSNDYTESLTCTVNITYKGTTVGYLTIREIKQYILNGNFTDSYVSNTTTTVTLVPDGYTGPIDNKPPVDPGTGTGSVSNPNSSTDDVNDPELPFADSFPFTDVPESEWFYDYVYYMWENKLMNGTSATLFSPNNTLTRGMVVTVLYRMEGEPDVAELDNPFPDVAAGQYFTNAVIWASDKKIVLGYDNGNFGPNDNVTREQLATMLHRYQTTVDKIPEIPEDAEEEHIFADDGSISGYAKDPVKALVAQGIITGKPENKFDPKGNATRAEFATMLCRYLKAIETE